MPQSLFNVLLHLVFSTKNREPLIDEAIEDDFEIYWRATKSNTTNATYGTNGEPKLRRQMLCQGGNEAEGLKCDSPGQRPGIEEMRATRPGRCLRNNSKPQTEPGQAGLLTDH